MTDPLTGLLAQALRDSSNYFTRPTPPARDVIAAIDPAKADWLRAGLLLGELADLWPEDHGISVNQAWDKSAWLVGVVSQELHGEVAEGPTLLAALTDLLAKLRVQP